MKVEKIEFEEDSDLKIESKVEELDQPLPLKGKSKNEHPIARLVSGIKKSPLRRYPNGGTTSQAIKENNEEFLQF